MEAWVKEAKEGDREALQYLVQQIHDRLRGLDEIERVAALFRSCPKQDPPASLVNLMKGLLDSGKYGSSGE